MAVKGLQRHKTIKEILIERNLVPEEKLLQAEAEANQAGKSFQQILLEQKLMEKDALLKHLSEEWQVKVADIASLDISADIVKIIPETMARRHLSLPFAKEENTLSVAMADPLDSRVLEDIEMLSRCSVQVFVSTGSEVMEAIQRCYGGNHA